jgi:hypothetical protein
MTLAELEPSVEAAIVSLEWELARARWRQGLQDERDAIEKAIPLAGTYGIEEEPLRDRLEQIAAESQGDVTADRVSVIPLRSVPMDLITAAVVRRILRIPAEIPVLSIKAMPSPTQIADAVEAIAARWSMPLGPVQEQI